MDDNAAGSTQSPHHNVTPLTVPTLVAPVPAAKTPVSTVAAPAAQHPLPRRALRVTFPEIADAEVIEFDPSSVPDRLDVNVQRWALFTGMWPTSGIAPPGKNAWKNNPNRDTSTLRFHFSRGYPTPPSHIARCQCIAKRNARELAEHLGYSDFQGSWPTFDDTVYLPKPNHTGEDASIHIDDLPIIGSAASLPLGEVGHVIQQPAKADTTTTDGSTNLLDDVSEWGDSNPPGGPEYSPSPNDESQWGDSNPPGGPEY